MRRSGASCGTFLLGKMTGSAFTCLDHSLKIPQGGHSCMVQHFVGRDDDVQDIG